MYMSGGGASSKKIKTAEKQGNFKKTHRRYRACGVRRSVRGVTLPPTLRHMASALLSNRLSKSITCGDVKRIGFGTKSAFSHDARRECPTAEIAAPKPPTSRAP